MLTEAARSRIEDAVGTNEVVLFMKGTPQLPQCGFSATAVQILNQLVGEFHHVNVLEDSEVREGIKEYGNWPTIPQLYVGGELLGGCDIMQEMFASGELHQALGLERPERVVPDIEITDAAAAAIRDAMQGEDASLALYMGVDADYQAQFALQPADAQAIASESNGITVHFDLMSAPRAQGAKIDFVDEMAGTGLRVYLPEAPPEVQEIDSAALRDRLEDDSAVVVVDVRTQADREGNEFPGAIVLDAETLADLEKRDKATPMVFVCNRGISSRSAAEHFRKRGFTNLANLRGGVEAWNSEESTGSA